MCWKFESTGEIKSGEKANMISMLNGECLMLDEIGIKKWAMVLASRVM
jgi:hypothetical protein